MKLSWHFIEEMYFWTFEMDLQLYAGNFVTDGIYNYGIHDIEKEVSNKY